MFAYGATGAGKTFTMLGNEYNYGITFLTMKDLYEKVKEQQSSKQFEIYVSYLEVMYITSVYYTFTQHFNVLELIVNVIF